MKGLFSQIYQGINDMCYIWWLEMKNTFKDEGVLIFFILVPLGYPLLYSWIYNNEVVREVPVAIVDMSHSNASRKFINMFDASPDTHAAYYCNNLQEAKDLVGKQQVHGTLYFPPDFEKQLGRGEKAIVDVYCDMSLMLTYKAIYQSAQAVALDMSSEIQKPKSGSITIRDEEISTNPIDVERVEIFNSTEDMAMPFCHAFSYLFSSRLCYLG